jgi:hypothetical protein
MKTICRSRSLYRRHRTEAMSLDGKDRMNLLRKFSKAMAAANSTSSSFCKMPLKSFEKPICNPLAGIGHSLR